MAEVFVNDTIKNNTVVVFSKSYCPFCKMAKQALKDAGLKEFTAIELDGRSDCDTIQNALMTITGARTVPRVFIGGKFVGGGSELQQLQQSNQLVPLLKSVGAL